MTKVFAKLSNSMTLEVEFISKDAAHRSAAKMIEEYAAAGVSVIELKFTDIPV